MRRIILGIVSALVLSVLPASSAAADSTVVVHGVAFPGDAVGIAAVDCSSSFTPLNFFPQLGIDRGPDTPPKGTRSMRFSLPDGPSASGIYADASSMSATTVVGVSLYGTAAMTGAAYAVYQAPADNGTNLYWQGRAELSQPPGGWRSVDVGGATYSWGKYNTTTGQLVQGGGSATVAAFTAANGNGDGYFIIGFGCNTQTFNLDAFRVGSPGSVTTYDLEAQKTKLAISAASTTTAGTAVTVNGRLQAIPTNDMAGQRVRLEAKAHGSSTYKFVGEDLSDDSGRVSLKVKPTKQTSYRWRFVEIDSSLGSLSAPDVVRVKTAVSATVADRTLRLGQRLVVAGKTTPAKPGFRATLWRAAPGGPVKVGSALISASGSYRIAATVRKTGKWTVWVTVPAATGNLAGTSPKRTLTVSR
ncbi:hypothetical protein [Nocardioides speluncae]|uniref:hypothetical protein n=1 Tax=Nocardioides speluncae TaxID=2670337 RepID=UPI000D68E779|nr:hypothetical protein [Nocardioides speluncae]